MFFLGHSMKLISHKFRHLQNHLFSTQAATVSSLEVDLGHLTVLIFCMILNRDNYSSHDIVTWG